MEPLDHSAFIARHEAARMAGPHSPGIAKSVCPLGSYALWTGGFALVALLFGLAFWGQAPWATPTVAGGALLFAAAIAVWAACVATRVRFGDPALLAAILQSSPAAHMVTNADGDIIYVTRALSNRMPPGAPPILASVAQIFEDPGAAEARMHRMARAALQGYGDGAAHIYARLAEGDARWLRVEVRRLDDLPGPRAARLYWRVEDVTDVKHKAIAAEAERDRLVDFTDNAPVGFFSLDEEGRFLFANATLARWLGQDLEALLTQGRMHPAFLASPPAGTPPWALEPCDETARRQAAELRMKGPGGSSFLAAISQTITREADGRVRTRGVVHDLTSQRSAAHALQAFEDRFQRFFDKAPVGIALLGRGGEINDCNAAFAAMLGLQIEKAEGQHIEALLAEADRARTLAALEDVAAGARKEAVEEVTLEAASGAVITRLYARRFQDTGGDGEIVLHAIDMTHHRHLEAQYAQSQKMQAVGQLAGGIAHDFNNLLTAMIGFCDLLLLRHRPGDPSFSDIMQIKQNANRASNLVRQILAFSRQQTLRPRLLDITEVLTEISHLLRRLLGANVTLDLTHGQDLGAVRVDPVQMEQVMINLAVNARDAMDGAGTLRVETENVMNREPRALSTREELPPGHWVRIAVSDTGCGMDAATLGRIFEPFFTTKDPGQGTGLGLATVYGIVRQTDGYLDVSSTPGEGTTFTLYIPQAGAAEESFAAAAKPATVGKLAREDLTGSGQILLVEDEDAVRAFSQRALEGKGYAVLAAESGDAALELLDAQGVEVLDLLVTDVVMPGMDGPGLAKALRTRFGDGLKIVFISGYTEDKLSDHMGPGIWFLPKPFTLRQLAAKIKEVIKEG